MTTTTKVSDELVQQFADDPLAMNELKTRVNKAIAENKEKYKAEFIEKERKSPKGKAAQKLMNAIEKDAASIDGRKFETEFIIKAKVKVSTTSYDDFEYVGCYGFTLNRDLEIEVDGEYVPKAARTYIESQLEKDLPCDEMIIIFPELHKLKRRIQSNCGKLGNIGISSELRDQLVKKFNNRKDS